MSLIALIKHVLIQAINICLANQFKTLNISYENTETTRHHSKNKRNIYKN